MAAGAASIAAAASLIATDLPPIATAVASTVIEGLGPKGARRADQDSIATELLARKGARASTGIAPLAGTTRAGSARIAHRAARRLPRDPSARAPWPRKPRSREQSRNVAPASLAPVATTVRLAAASIVIAARAARIVIAARVPPART